VLSLIAVMLPVAVAGAPPAPGPVGWHGRAPASSFTQEWVPYVAEILESGEGNRAHPPALVSRPPADAPDARLASILHRGDLAFSCPPAAILTGRRNE